MADSVDRTLPSYATGATSLGMLHLNYPESSREMGYRPLQPYLDSKGISYVVIPAASVAEKMGPMLRQGQL
jgi:hypothetical protein